MDKVVLFIVGPTASGKSDLAINIAQRFDGVVVNCDSKQVYRQIPIITAQPTQDMLELVSHRLYGYVDMQTNYSVMEWISDVVEQIKQIHTDGKIPIICGGTGMYVHCLINGISPVPRIDEDLRQMVRQKADSSEFYNFVLEKDPLVKDRIKSGDIQRLTRVAEVMLQTGRSIFDWYAEPKIGPWVSNYSVHVLFPERHGLYSAINNRFLDMIESGALDEVKGVIEYDPKLSSMTATGIPELSRYLRGCINLEQAIAEAQMLTRRYAKRQYTWFSKYCRDANFHQSSAKALEEISKYLSKER